MKCPHKYRTTAKKNYDDDEGVTWCLKKPIFVLIFLKIGQYVTPLISSKKIFEVPEKERKKASVHERDVQSGRV